MACPELARSPPPESAARKGSSAKLIEALLATEGAASKAKILRGKLALPVLPPGGMTPQAGGRRVQRVGRKIKPRSGGAAKWGQ